MMRRQRQFNINSIANRNAITFCFLGLSFYSVSSQPVNAEEKVSRDSRECKISILNHKKRRLASEQVVNLCDYSGKVILIVNTASRCGHTPQYEALNTIYTQFEQQGFVVLGFPSNDFGSQEPDSEEQIKDFCKLTYDVKFPMFSKTNVLSAPIDPIYKSLAKAADGDLPKWNFHKYLINRDGQLVNSFPSHLEPDSPEILSAIKKLL